MIVGLGNPGKSYQGNRHNIGFQVLDLLAQQHGLSFDLRKGKARLALGSIGLPATGGGTHEGDRDPFRVLLAKPQTFMNACGQSVASLARFYKLQPDRILVVYDDLDLELGRLRLRPAGGSGGHRGMRSIIDQLGSQDFPRLRLGIGRPPGRMDPAAYVLQDFSPAQEELMAPARALAVEACEHWLAHGSVSTMNAFNSPGLEPVP